MLKEIAKLMALMVIAAIMLLFFLDAMAREDEMRDGIRQERCTKMGENMPAAMAGYCKGQ